LRFLHVFLFSFFSVFSVFCQEKKHTVYFDTDLSVVSGIERNRLLSFVFSLSEEDLSRIEIYGFCDDVGANSYNLTLSQNRANEIKKILLHNDVPGDKITNVDGKGELLLKKVKTTSADRVRALNRKVELTVSFDVLKNNTTEPLSRGSSLIIENLLFLTGYSYLTPSSKKSLDLAFEKIKDLPFSFIIQGHVCCTSGQKDAVDRATKKRNLSVVRAKYVYDYFVGKGINSKRMSYEGLGHRFPLGGRSDADRRVEILITSDF
jgi:outer membrane protein OmpA-like peptidoglycan-associated protein